jgi:Methyltransferase domain
MYLAFVAAPAAPAAADNFAIAFPPSMRCAVKTDRDESTARANIRQMSVVEREGGGADDFLAGRPPRLWGGDTQWMNGMGRMLSTKDLLAWPQSDQWPTFPHTVWQVHPRRPRRVQRIGRQSTRLTRRQRRFLGQLMEHRPPRFVSFERSSRGQGRWWWMWAGARVSSRVSWQRKQAWCARSVSLEVARSHAGSERVDFVVADVLTYDFPEVLVWHDRAVFHFFTTSADQERYAAQAVRAVQPGGYMVLGTFDADGGPERCSGLAVRRWTAADLAAFFEPFGFELKSSCPDTHTTPSGATQKFIYVVLAKRR